MPIRVLIALHTILGCGLFIYWTFFDKDGRRFEKDEKYASKAKTY